MMESPDHAESLIAMASIVVAGQTLETTLRQVLDLACAALPGGDGGGITLLGAEGPHTAVATSDAALRVDNTQYDAETSGPCLDAYRQQRVLRIDSTAADERWPQFAATAVAEGFASTLSVPLVVGGDGLGAINIYSRREYGFPADDERLAAALGACASVALANARAYWQVARLAGQLQEALDTRGVIEQATGVIIVQRGCSADRAFHLLAEVSQRNRLTVLEVAADVVERALSQGLPAT